jgi:hypothetical protein
MNKLLEETKKIFDFDYIKNSNNTITIFFKEMEFIVNDIFTMQDEIKKIVFVSILSKYSKYFEKHYMWYFIDEDNIIYPKKTKNYIFDLLKYISITFWTIKFVFINNSDFLVQVLYHNQFHFYQNQTIVLN